MYASFSSSALLFHDLLGDLQFRSRRLLLLHNPLNLANPPPSLTTHNSTQSYHGDTNFDTNVVMVLSVLLCALICSLGLNSIIRCAWRCSNLGATTESAGGSLPPASLANTGVKKKALKTFPTVSYSADLKLPGLDTECVICLSDFANGDRLRILPICNHGFHLRCIDKWLTSHSSCPKCRHCLIRTCEKIVGCTTQPTSSQPLHETILTIAPLQPEALVRSYREVSN